MADDNKKGVLLDRLEAAVTKLENIANTPSTSKSNSFIKSIGKWIYGQCTLQNIVLFILVIFVTKDSVSPEQLPTVVLELFGYAVEQQMPGVLEEALTVKKEVEKITKELSVTKKPGEEQKIEERKITVNEKVTTNSEKVTVNVGGKIFQTLKQTLSKSNYFSQHLTDDEIFIDRDGSSFEFILNALRGQPASSLKYLPESTLKSLQEDAKFYGVDDLVKEIEKITNGEETNSGELLTENTGEKEGENVSDLASLQKRVEDLEKRIAVLENRENPNA